MSDALLESLVSALGDKQVAGCTDRVHEASAAARRAEVAAADVHALRSRTQITPVPSSVLDTTQCVPAAVLERCKRVQRDLAGSGAIPLSIEAGQHKAVSQLASLFASLTGDALGKKWYTHFEAWLFARRGDGAQAASGHTCMLPTGVGPAAVAADQELQRKLLAAGVGKTVASDVVAELARLPDRLVPSATVKTEPHVKVRPFKGQKGVVQKLRLTCEGISLEINRLHYDKLRALYSLRPGAAGVYDATAFTRAACAMLLRYSSLQGTHFRGGGFQAAVHSEVLEALRQSFDCCFECFASPLNAHYPLYCSMFLDTDHLFGSLGSFFHFHPKAGSFQANPPFDKQLVERMAQHMFTLLEGTQDALMFTVIIPTWEGQKCWELLRHSQHTKHCEELDAGKHGFCEGAQHNRANQFRAASTGTSILFLQTSAAASKWPVTDANIAKLLQAFQPKSASFTGAAVMTSAGECSGTLDDTGAAKVSAGADVLIQGDFSRGVVPAPRKHRPLRKANLHVVSHKSAQEQNCTRKVAHAGAGSRHRNNELVDEHSASGLAGDEHRSSPAAFQKRKRPGAHIASSTGKFAPEATAKAVVERLLADVNGPPQPCAHDAKPVGVGEKRRRELKHVATTSLQQQSAVAFPLSKSQRQKANRLQSARRKSAKRPRK